MTRIDWLVFRATYLRPWRAIAVVILGLVLPSLVPLSKPVQAALPPFTFTPELQTRCTAAAIAQAKAAGKFGAIPGTTNDMGFLASKDSPQNTDAFGNTIAVYCVDGKNGPEFGYRFYPGDGKGDFDVNKGVWIGACTLDTGQNLFTASRALIPAGGGGNRLGNFVSFSWLNFQDFDPRAPPNKKDYQNYEYTYTIATNQLSIEKTLGSYVKGPGGANDYKPVKDPGPKMNPQTIAPPKNFSGLVFDGKQLTYLNKVDNQVGGPTVALGLLNRNGGVSFNFAMLTNWLGGDGTSTNPVLGEQVPITAGDTLTLDVTSTGGSVSGSAALSANGGWAFEGLTSNTISFDATANTVLEPGELIGGFTVDGNLPQSGVVWALTGADPLANDVGLFPVPETGTLGVLGASLVLLATFRRTRPLR